MYQYGQISKERLATVDSHLRDVMEQVIKIVDVTIACGHRTKQVQNKAFKSGNSTKEWPNSKHNRLPSKAVDAVPYIKGKGVQWDDREAITYMAGLIVGIGHVRGLKIRWGGDWDKDGETSDNKWDDLFHFELV